MTPKHAAARDLASRGIPVFPCVVDGKTPATDNGFHDATCDLAQIDAWWGQADYNPAFQPSKAGLCVVDVEDNGREAWAAWELEHGVVPETYKVEPTPRGGFHLYFRGDLPPTVERLGPHIDTRGGGSYVLVPPSTVEGNPYVGGPCYPSLCAEVPPAVILGTAKRHSKVEASPDVVLDDPASVERAKLRIASYLKAGDVAIEGEAGNSRTFKLAAELANLGISEARALELIEPWNAQCQPPWDQDDLEVVVANGYRYAENEPGAYAITGTGQELFGEQAASFGPKLRYKLHKVSEIRRRPPREWLIPDMLKERSVGIMYGMWSSYKSFMAVTLAMPIARTRKVVYIAGEDEDGIANAVAAWCYANELGEDDHQLRIIEDMPHAIEPSDIFSLIDDLAAQHWRPDLVFIDTAARCMAGLEENSAKEMGVLITAMDTIRKRLGCAVVAIHHAGKNGELRGSTAIPGGLDTLVKVQADPKLSVAELTMEKIKGSRMRQEPWCYEGTELAGSLVFKAITPAAYRLTGQDEALEPRAVGAALSQMQAVGAEAGVTTHSLAFHMAGPDASPEGVSVIEKALSVRANHSLRAYCLGIGQGRRWSLPS